MNSVTALMTPHNMNQHPAHKTAAPYQIFVRELADDFTREEKIIDAFNAA
jgi:hypothetical protein